MAYLLSLWCFTWCICTGRHSVAVDWKDTTATETCLRRFSYAGRSPFRCEYREESMFTQTLACWSVDRHYSLIGPVSFQRSEQGFVSWLEPMCCVRGKTNGWTLFAFMSSKNSKLKMWVLCPSSNSRCGRLSVFGMNATNAFAHSRKISLVIQPLSDTFTCDPGGAPITHSGLSRFALKIIVGGQ